MSTLRDYLQVVRRRKWVIAQAAVLVPVVAVLFSVRQEAVYRSSADVLLSRQNLATTLTGVQDTTNIGTQADRAAQTQADLARSPEVATRALRAARVRPKLTVSEFLGASSVTAKQNADLLTFAVENHEPSVAARLANEYADAYKDYRKEVETAPIKAAIEKVRARIAELGSQKGPLFNNLVDKEEQLTTMETLQGSNATVVKRADGAVQIAPRPVRNGVLGLILGLFLGVGLAYAYVAYRIGDGADAEDVTSATFERALRYRSSFDRKRGDPAAWLIGIARRCISEHMADRLTPTGEVPELAAHGDLEADSAARLDLATAVARLDERDRDLVALRYGADLSARAIADVLGLKTNTVEVALHRVLRRLRDEFEERTEPETEQEPSPRVATQVP